MEVLADNQIAWLSGVSRVGKSSAVESKECGVRWRKERRERERERERIKGFTGIDMGVPGTVWSLGRMERVQEGLVVGE